MRPTATLAAASLLFAALLACSTTGAHVDRWDFGCQKEVWLDPTGVSDAEQAHIVGITSALASHGLKLVSSEEPTTSLELKFELAVRNPFNFRSTVVLLDEGTPIASAESVNPGWGNLIARGAAIRAIVRRATAQFSEELERIEADAASGSCGIEAGAA